MTEIITRIRADTSEIDGALERLKNLSSEFSSQLTQGMKSAMVSGRELEDVLKKIGLNIAGMALTGALKPLTGLFGKFFQGSSGAGGIFGNVMPFAQGGVISTPSYFPFRGGSGVAGEAGAEAILPLQRSTDGTLGVALAGGGSSSPLNIVFNVTASDVTSFRKSEAQITEMLARAVRRGARAF